MDVHEHQFCDGKDPRMNDYYKPCKPQNSTEDFLTSYHNLIDNSRNYGFNPSKSSIPVEVNAFLISGAQRLASRIVLSQPVCIQHLSYNKVFTFDYMFFHSLGLQKRVIEMVMLEYLKLQLHLN
jgi:hypothetical protein